MACDHHPSPEIESPSALKAAGVRGFRDGFGVPIMSIFASMAGFGALAREAGFDVVQSVTTTAIVWGLPGQVAMASLHLAGASALVVFTAVALANFRMMLMVASAMDMMGLKGHSIGLAGKFMLMHFLAITSWVQLGHIEGDYTPRQLLRYYKCFGGVIYLGGLSGAGLGYYLSEVVSIEVLRGVLMLTPLYILLMVVNARRLSNRYAAAIGGLLCPLSFPLIGEWGILLGGVAGGSLVVWVNAMKRRHERQGRHDV
jgi:predicted branched-subunit amino acid permease